MGKVLTFQAPAPSQPLSTGDGAILKFRRPRRQTIRGAAREMLTDVMGAVGKPMSVTIVVLGEDGRYSFRRAGYDDAMAPFDQLSRASRILDRARDEFMD